jgi:class 3 adenylate cyclase
VRAGPFFAGLRRACWLTVLSSSTPSPVGETTLLFTYIEGSTRLARTLGAGWPGVVDEHHRLLESAIVGCGGHVERTAGDSFLALFIDPVQAVQAAVDAQRSLARHQWPHQTGALRVRMGVHTGSVGRGERDLIGLDLHLAARVQAAAHGGQIPITQTTRDALANKFSVKSLGLHRLKDFPVPERLFQVVVDGRGPAAFPPVRTTGPQPTKPPVELRSLLGSLCEPEQPPGNPRPCRPPTIQPALRARALLVARLSLSGAAPGSPGGGRGRLLYARGGGRDACRQGSSRAAGPPAG